jgi:hypothetical protein
MLDPKAMDEKTKHNNLYTLVNLNKQEQDDDY